MVVEKQHSVLLFSVEDIIAIIYCEMEVYWVKSGEVYVCSICGNKVEVIKDGDGPVVCCGQDMEAA